MTFGDFPFDLFVAFVPKVVVDEDFGRLASFACIFFVFFPQDLPVFFDAFFSSGGSGVDVCSFCTSTSSTLDCA